MYKILTLTDFSKNSNSAIEFTKTLASKSHSEVTILHALSPTMGTITLSDQSVELNNILFENSIERMDQIVSDFSDQNISANALIKKGDLVSILNQIISELNIDLLIISSHGYGNQGNKFTGKNTAYIIANVYTPTLIVPTKYEFKGLKNTSFVHQLKKAKFNHLTEAFKFLKSFDINDINILHILSNEQDVFKADKSGLHKTKDYFPDQNVSFTFIEGEYVVDSLLSFLKESPKNLIIISSNRKTFWKRLIAGNIHMKPLAQFSTPILILTDTPPQKQESGL